MKRSINRVLLIALTAIIGCSHLGSENVARTQLPLTTVKSVVIDNGTFGTNWTSYSGSFTKSSSKYLYGGTEKTLLRQFAAWNDFAISAKSQFAVTDNDIIEFDVYGGTTASVQLEMRLNSRPNIALSGAYCSPVIATATWSHCSIPVSALGGPVTVSYIDIQNPRSVAEANIAFTNFMVVTELPAGTGGAPSTGGASATGGAPTGGSSEAGGNSATGGNSEIGGTSAIGGNSSAGGTTAENGGTTSVAGTTGFGGQSTAGTSSSTGGASEIGGTTSTAGSSSIGGVSSVGGSAGSSSVYHMPRVGLNAPAFSNVGTASLINDGGYKYGYVWSTSGCSVSTPCWNAVNVGSGPSRILLQLSYESGSGVFSSSSSVHAYSVMVSHDSTNGTDGTWVTATDALTQQPVVVSGNMFIFRAHTINFVGYSWIKLVVTSTGAPNIDELDMLDASVSSGDWYFFNGDSITARCLARGTSAGWDERPSFQDHFTDHVPMMTCGGTVGVSADFADANIDSYLSAFSAKYQFFVYGTNDLNWTSVSAFKASAQSWITKVKTVGRTPILSHVIWANNVPSYGAGNEPAFNQAIDELVVSNNLLPAVPLYEATVNHPEYFESDDVHPNHLGCQTGWSPTFANYIKTHSLY